MHSLEGFTQPSRDGEKLPRANIGIHWQRETGWGKQKSVTPPGKVVLSGLRLHTTEVRLVLYLEVQVPMGGENFRNVPSQHS